MSYNSPIDFTSGTAYTQCSDTCKFTFKYSDSSCTVRKFTILDQQCLYASYDTGNSSTNVVYNGISYVPYMCLIFNGSFHTYDKEKSPGELLIVHHGDGGAGAGKTLIVCIPISISDTSTLSESGEIIDQIIKTVPKAQVSKSDESSSPFGVKGLYNLSQIIPENAPYYTYIGNAFYSTRSEAINYVVYTQGNVCKISQAAMTNLNAIVKKNNAPTTSMPVNTASLNSIGANGSSSNQIYIECKPTGDDGVILYKKSLKGGVDGALDEEALSSPSSDIFENPMFISIIGLICVILFFGLIFYIIKLVGGDGDGGGGDGKAAAPTAAKK
jgi:carbonic anhydrase